MNSFPTLGVKMAGKMGWLTTLWDMRNILPSIFVLDNLWRVCYTKIRKRGLHMGFFSWITSDTNQSIPNRWSGREMFPVYCLQPGGRPTLVEKNYDGYGVFGGRDIFALMVEWNCPERATGNDDEDRMIGIDLLYSDNPDILRPRFAEIEGTLYEEVEDSKDCPEQGFFYCCDEEVDEIDEDIEDEEDETPRE